MRPRPLFRLYVSPHSSHAIRMQRDVVTVERFYTEQAGSLGLKLVAGANGLKRVIREPTVNRPGLALAGFTKYFASKRVQVIGSAESTFLKSLGREERERRYADLFAYKIPCVVYRDRKSTRLNSSHMSISYAVFCLKKKI